MAFWLSILAGIVFAAVAFRRSFYLMWTILFNITISIYLGIMLTYTAVKTIDAISCSSYSYAGCVLGIAIVTFVILQFIAIRFFAATFKVTFSKIFDNIGAALLAFIAGFLVFSFISFSISITPIVDNPFMQEVISGQQIAKSSAPVVLRTCNLVGVLSAQKNTGVTGDFLSWLLATREETWDEPADESYQQD